MKKYLIFTLLSLSFCGHLSAQNPLDELSHEAVREALDLTTDEGCKAGVELIKADVERFKKGGDLEGMFPERWLPSTFAVLPEAFTEQNGMMNSTMKVVRGKVEKFYSDRIDHLYTPEGKVILNEKNIASLK
jgi:long-chain acyl-CoA synthetase